VTGCLY